MPRKSKNEDLQDDSEEEEEEEEELEQPDDEPPTIEPYTVLGIEKSATADEIKSAYRKAALKHHPDKAAPHLKDEAHTKFQEIAFAYAVLSDPIRRKRYDKTGSTSESVEVDGDFSWTEFYSEQYRDVVTEDAIDRFAASYKNSDEERDDVVKAYEKWKGNWGGIYGSVMLSKPSEDEERFRGYIDAAIESGDVESYKVYAEETERAKQKRLKRVRKEEEQEAEEAEVESKKLQGKKKAKKDDGLADLAALIQKRQSSAGTSFLDNLEKKARAQDKENREKGQRGKKAKKRVQDEDQDGDEPSEEAFQAAAKKLKTGNGEIEGRKTSSPAVQYPRTDIQYAMTSVPNNIYPDYCHRLSPTIGKWCPLQATDVHRLKTVGVFSDERALYHLDNHPVKWVRITGVVVAVDEFRGKRVFTVDDSSGMCIECTAITPPPPPVPDKTTLPAHLNQIASIMHVQITTKKPTVNETKQDAKIEGKDKAKVVPSVASPIVPWEEVDVGTVVKVKGRVNNYWDTIQVEVIKIEVLRCTDQEVRCWNEVAAFKKEVLSGPWVVSEEEEERCRKWRERELRHARKGRTGKDGRLVRKGGEINSAADAEGRRRRRRDAEEREMEKKEEDGNRRNVIEQEGIKAQAKAKRYPSMATIKAAKGKYDALGI
ncbi:uncharacterized protein RAG0_05215 [Rhynchosporium agropyri]|uniref:J domain-containing protein n=1 Tax=Rhynchosporium agropyri TaxID=914238 RepID=A0A1E1KC80_9HELO|nr:uncharacterized protein RAG0_05215 [Rhynchosporium agropyri]